ncbi:MAG: CBS domain-containing protein [Deferribacteres bacterium]|nr:CBS domain-containing protein [candidate division KSB1 bacterium]MCB9511114.1 CBS domain-containing protein [Deferribacteres bacterium]
MNLLKIARKPPIIVLPQDSVMKAVEKMVKNKVGGVAVEENGVLVGIFTERDLQTRVVHKHLSALDTPVSEVMTRDPHTAPVEMEASAAFEFMTSQHFRHLPIVDENGKILGMLSVRHLMARIVEYLSHELESMNAYIGADGIGG